MLSSSRKPRATSASRRLGHGGQTWFGLYSLGQCRAHDRGKMVAACRQRILSTHPVSCIKGGHGPIDRLVAPDAERPELPQLPQDNRHHQHRQHKKDRE